MKKKAGLCLLEGFGIEIEYMIVRKETLDVFPVSDEIIRSASGKYSNDYDNGHMGWSNEFVLHVMELKNTGPVPSLKGLAKDFHEQVRQINRILLPLEGRLMPSGMHPWMDPRKETKLWPHGCRKVYETYDGIFNCRRHGWANLQSMHINVSFNGDAEFERLHAAMRLLMPLIPALAASSPVAGGRVTGLQDTRLFHYRSNQRRVPVIMGRIIPEPVYTEADYRKEVFDKIYRGIAEYDPGGILRHEWLNSRGVIPRFERSALEIRVIDTQECASANIAVAELIVDVLRQLTDEKWASLDEQKRWKVSPLVSVFRETVKNGERAVIDDPRYLRMFGFSGARAEAGELWRHLADESGRRGLIDARSMRIIKFMLDEGTLSRRILRSLGKDPSRTRLREVYGRLCRCLAGNELFDPNDADIA